MLIPAIDLQRGRVVQLVQGEQLALASDDLDGWIERFGNFPKVQVIDLDAAKGEGNNGALVQSICQRLPCRVGGGIRSIERASEAIVNGARKVILGSALFRDGMPDLDLARSLSDTLGEDRLIAAVDARGGRVVVHGWRSALDLSPVEAIHILEPFFGEFLFTNVDVEGLMQGTDRAAIEQVRAATKRQITAAGGITTREEIDWLDSLGIDAVVGMAVYTGRLPIDSRRPDPGRE
jgi:phosphoribosylformimino-5-aminoimidazole carboxamide ribotide isomerase